MKKKKKYMPPELNKVIFSLTSDILLGSVEHDQTYPAGGELIDPDDDDTIEIGGLW